MTRNYLINKQEQMNMGFLIFNGNNFLVSAFNILPERIIRHSKRVMEITGLMAEHIPNGQLPEDPEEICVYKAAICFGARYHELGIFLAENDLENRPAATEKMLKENWRGWTYFSSHRETVFETVRSCHERYDGKGYPCSLREKAIPIHAGILCIADVVDMFFGEKEPCDEKKMKILDYVRRNSGKFFRPDAVACFEKASKKIFEYYTLEYEQTKCESAYKSDIYVPK